MSLRCQSSGLHQKDASVDNHCIMGCSLCIATLPLTAYRVPRRVRGSQGNATSDTTGCAIDLAISSADRNANKKRGINKINRYKLIKTKVLLSFK